MSQHTGKEIIREDKDGWKIYVSDFSEMNVIKKKGNV